MTQSTGRPAKTRDEGQWALGSTDPLNPNEVFKTEDPALNVRERIENVYSKQGFDSIDKTDLRGRMRWWRGGMSISSASAPAVVVRPDAVVRPPCSQLAAGSASPVAP